VPITVPEHLTPDAVREALRSVLDEPAYAAAARAVRDQIAAMPDLDATARRIEQLEHPAA
jgi:UDP:flavonoid glycosyltransferase YjiC (YdhE family)